ncbi:SEZ6 isoform 4, partial [Pongo abelii]
GKTASTTPPSRAWTPTQEGLGDMGRPWVPEVVSQGAGIRIQGTITSSTASGDDEETTTTTTTITTVQTPGPCSWNFSGPEGSLDSPTDLSSPTGVGLDCFFYISVYPGYGVEIKVQNISLREGETVTVEGLGGPDPLPLANQSFLLRGQVIRSPTHQVALRFQSLPPPAGPGTFHFHYQAYLLSCHFPRRPAYGDVTVTSLHPGGSARFHCATGYQLKGTRRLTCLNATQPFWDSKEPICIAACGGVIRNATTGRIVSPGFPGNYSNNLTCHWLLEAPEGQRLHLHFEKVSLAEDDDRLIIRNGDNVEAPPVYDSYEVEYLPIEGLLSSGKHFFVELSTDSSGAAAGMALRYEAAHPPTLWVPLWSSAATLATPWSRAPSSSSVLTPMTPSGMRQSQPAEPCAAGRPQTRLAWCSLPTGPSPMVVGRIASGVCMWKRTSASCWTSECCA